MLKIIYWILFKIVYRLELKDVRNLYIKSKQYTGKPFLIVQNHCSSRDVIMLITIWAHLGKYSSVLVSTLAFNKKNRLSTIFSHFLELIPHYGTGQNIVLNMTKRLLNGDLVAIFPEGSQPHKEFKNSGFVQEMYTGATRVAYCYWKLTGKNLIIQPSCSLGANNVFPPRNPKEKIKKTKIFLKFGEPFILEFSEQVEFNEIREKTREIAMNIAKIWGQKKLIPNYNFEGRKSYFKKSGKFRMYTALNR
jgi:1-acyl-sn-glycerol-3-phosphate acyltransferase